MAFSIWFGSVSVLLIGALLLMAFSIEFGVVSGSLIGLTIGFLLVLDCVIGVTATGAGLLLRDQPFLHACSPIKHGATEACPWRSEAKRIPSIERAHVSPQFGGEFFFR
ncbi:MAG: hypothetical protein ACLPTZ_08265 [Beijerinckiaceae bacterium]